MDEFEHKKKKILTPLLVEAGAALLDCQTLEYGISLLLYHFSRIGVQGLDPKRMEAIMENVEKKTVGQLISMLKQHLSMSGDLERKLKEALVARNNLIHRILVDNIEFVIDQKERHLLVKRIQVLRSKLQKANKSISPFVESFSKAIDGFDSDSAKLEVISYFINSDVTGDDSIF
jgi:hypothetical protein